MTFARIKHRAVANLMIQEFDLEDDFRKFGEFDIVIHMGLLYHLSSPGPHLSLLRDVTEDVLLESLVLESDDDGLCETVQEDATDNQMSLHGTGSRFSESFVERIADEVGFEVAKFVDSDANSDEHIYDWDPETSQPLRTWGRRRLWRLTSAQRPDEP